MDILDEEHSSTKLPYNRMILSGFSQGGALSIFTGLQVPADKKLGGVLVMSGYLAGAKQFTLSEAGKEIPVLHCHGTSDPMVRFDMAQKTEELVKGSGHSNYTLKPYSGLTHSVSVDELKDAAEFIHGVIPPDASCDIKPKSPDEMSVKELKTAIRLGGLGNQAVGLAEKRELVELLKNNQK